MIKKPHLLGQETELAIRFEPQDGVEHPGNKVIFEYLAAAIKSLVKTRPGKRNFIQDQFFTENGGAVYYEHHPQSLRKGLIEFATPECGSAHELILYQRAQEALLAKAVPIAQSMLATEGVNGTLSLIKNSRDFEGNTYGCQENYDSTMAKGRRLLGLRLGLMAYLPLSLLTKLIYITALIPFVFIVFVAKVCLELIAVVANQIAERLPGEDNVMRRLSRWAQRFDLEASDTEEHLLRLEYGMFYPLFWLSYKPLIMLYNRMAFVEVRQAVEAFIISRIVFTGAGSLLPDNRFIISEKSLSITSFLRRSIHRTDKPLFDCGNLIKEYELSVWELFLLRLSPIWSLTQSEQRLQVSFSDSNRCQFAEFLKIGLTHLMVRMANDGALRDAPRFADPVAALRAISQDLSLNESVTLKDGRQLSAMQIQAWYLEQAKSYLQTLTQPPMEYHELLRLWQETLERLAHDPLKLIGRIDWVTKRYLLETSGADLDYWARKKIDLRYHELATGYYETLAAKQLTLDFFNVEEIDEAMTQPSSPDRVRLRSRLIKSVALKDQYMTVSWSQVKLGRWRPRLIVLDDYRRSERPPADQDHLV